MWEDPIPKPCYLFALVAGNLGSIKSFFVTKSGRKVREGGGGGGKGLRGGGGRGGGNGSLSLPCLGLTLILPVEFLRWRFWYALMAGLSRL